MISARRIPTKKKISLRITKKTLSIAMDYLAANSQVLTKVLKIKTQMPTLMTEIHPKQTA